MANIKKENKKVINKKYKVKETKKNKNSKKVKGNFNTIEVIAVMIITALFGVFIGSVATYFAINSRYRVNNKNIKELISVYDEVVEGYYGEINDEELLEAGIKGMIDYLEDPYSSYLDSEVSKEFNETIEGEYVGLGAEISQNFETKQLTVVTVFKNSPAEKSGLKVHDVIYKVDNKPVEELSLNEITEIIKNGDIGTTVKLNVKREGKDIVVEFQRGKVELTSVTGEIIEKSNKKIGFVRIDVFAKNSYKQFESVINDLKQQGMESLIIDVRDNSGGYLTTVKSIADMFLDKNEVIFIVKDKNGEEKQLSTKKKSIDVPVVVLINGGSASASEILAAALNENLGADLVGLKTYGKGSVQTTKTLNSGAIIKYTIQEWLTPAGKSIEDNGVSPTVEIELSEAYYNEPTKENDNQLQKALEILLLQK
ncbi:MAG: S41 family peptidase [Bacilli bacterium]|nr:S41 family peptidase [Bacilli bacterium]